MFTEQMTRLSAWISTTAPSQFVQGIDGYVPAFQSLHILAIAAVIAAAAMLNLRILNLMNRSLTLVEVSVRFRRPIFIGTAVLALSGFALLLAEPQRSLVSRVFQLKMLLLVVALVLSVRLARLTLRHAAQWDASASPMHVKATALVALLLWISIVIAGRWIAYAQY